LPAGGCYLARTLAGGLEILAARRPISRVLADPGTDPALAAKLRRVLEMRAFASDALALPDNASYRSWVELDRPYAVWNVTAAPELALEPVTWCFPVVGCVSYRGYFSQARAERYAAKLRRRGDDVAVGGVAAYSTLGWFRDPVLSTFLDLPPPELAGLIFHELAHQRLYIAGDVPFNESFATAVELAGVRRWLAARGEGSELAGWRERRRREEDFHRLLRRTRERLAQVYAASESDGWKRRRKAEVFARLRSEYRELRDGEWRGYAGYDPWFAQDLGNAHLAALEAYDRWVPALEALLGRLGGDLPRFYAEVERLGELPQEEREAALAAAGEGFR
jgi:predicted aminopeptidase